MPVQYINGVRFRNAVVVAAQRLLDCQERLNRINVFPIPDGDTGTNMALTLKCVAESAINAGRCIHLSDMARIMADAALMGSCGNSGAIITQFFQGLAKSFEGRSRIGWEHFSRAVSKAVHMAESAVAEPMEGTILTIMRAWSDFLLSRKKGDFAALISQSLIPAQSALEGTPKQLEALARAGVVDAGAQGFVNMLEGVVDYIKSGEMVWAPPVESGLSTARVEQGAVFEYQYCTECMIEGSSLNIGDIREAAHPFGDSLIVAGSGTKARVHVHTNDPSGLFVQLSRFGAISKRKREDMQAQYNQKSDRKIALIVDSSCDLPTDYIIRHQIRLVPVRVTFGAQTYLDRINITGEEIYRMMAESTALPTTSQPSPASFKQAFDLAAETHEQAIAITLSGAVSGTHHTCVEAARQQNKMDIRVIDSKTTAGAMGLLTIVAAEAIGEGCHIDEVVNRLEEARSKVRLLAVLENLDYLVRGGRLSRFRGRLANLLRLTPVLTFGSDGRIKALARARTGKGGLRKVVKLAIEACRQLENPRFLVCHAANEEAAMYFQKALQDHFQQDHIEILSVSPTLGVHAGPGASAICLIGD